MRASALDRRFRLLDRLTSEMKFLQKRWAKLLKRKQRVHDIWLRRTR